MRVKVPEVLAMVLAAAWVIKPLSVLLPEALMMAPVPPIPLPETVMASAMVRVPEIESTAPLAMVVPPAVVPKLLLLLTANVPALMVVAPV